VTVTLFSSTTVQVEPLAVLHPFQLTEVDVPVGVPVKITPAPAVNVALHDEGVEQSIPAGELVTVPVPVPLKLTVKTGWGPAGVHPRLAGPSTVTNMKPTTTFPFLFPPSVKTLAEMLAPPQSSPAVRWPVLSTRATGVTSDAQITWLVMSLVSGGCMYVP
jgi:hypothetical protein